MKINEMCTPQNNLRTTQCKFPYVVYLVRSVAQTRHDIDKRFSVPIQGVKNKAFPFKNLAFKFFAPPKFASFSKFSKNHVLPF